MGSQYRQYPSLLLPYQWATVAGSGSQTFPGPSLGKLGLGLRMVG